MEIKLTNFTEQGSSCLSRNSLIHGTKKLIIVFTWDCHQTPLWATLIQYTSALYFYKMHFNIIPHSQFGASGFLFFSGLQTNILHSSPISLMATTRPPSTFFCYMTLTTFRGTRNKKFAIMHFSPASRSLGCWNNLRWFYRRMIYENLNTYHRDIHQCEVHLTNT
jgi:hypothetical protein